jgi:hypothetical protein
MAFPLASWMRCWRGRVACAQFVASVRSAEGSPWITAIARAACAGSYAMHAMAGSGYSVTMEGF